ncbi:HNH endonuclease signature motif containing protein [Nesterenkonia suensis]
MEHQHRNNQRRDDGAAVGGAGAGVLPERIAHLADEPELTTGYELLITSRQAEARAVTALLAYQDRRNREAENLGLGFHERRAASDAATRNAALTLGVSEPAALGILTAARTTRASMPATWAVYSSGVVDTARMRAIARASQTLLRPADVEHLDAAAADAATRLTPGELRSWLRRYTAGLNPAQYAADCAAARADRWVRVQHDDHAMSYLEARLPTIAAAAIANRLRAAARGQQHPIPVPAGLHTTTAEHTGAAHTGDDPAAASGTGAEHTGAAHAQDHPAGAVTQRQAQVQEHLPVEHPELPAPGTLDEDPGQNSAQQQHQTPDRGQEQGLDRGLDRGQSVVPVQVQDGPEILPGDTPPPGDADRLELAPDDADCSDLRTLAQREADLFTAWLLVGRVDGAAIEAKIAVMIPEATLTGDSQAPGVSADRTWVIPPEDARHLAAQDQTPPTSTDGTDARPGTGAGASHDWYQARYQPTQDPAGSDGLDPTDDEADILSITYTGRYAPARLRDAITFRDGTCRAPGCETPVPRCDLDHRLPYPAGATTGNNLQALCRRHHRLKSHGHLTLPEPVSPEPPTAEPVPPEPTARPPAPSEHAPSGPIPPDPSPPGPGSSEKVRPSRRHHHRHHRHDRQHRSPLERALHDSLPHGAAPLRGAVDLLHCTARIRI